ncbi:sodium-coupled monocarboxylate transporter 1-like [Phlebotomus argentipes]|uniref:sodium-coupled monocarboxylate transporter 1-like n=1 Tax=Phlebotomus argentipes TaxID=94469 RepID=UPI002893576B|nr:sodium-coupled monocarboxylate transporter 1-like [Phlebotomus argentipes]
MSLTFVRFSHLDYFFFSIVFVVSIAIGVFFAFGKRRQSMEEFLFGGRNLKLLPVSFSLAATIISGSTIIGQSIETYAYGFHNWIVISFFVPWVLAMRHVFLPVFYELQLESSFSYLEMRFDKTVKHIASTFYVISGLIFMSLTLYVPALAFQEVTGFDLYAILVIMSAICIWYTIIGGIRAIIWTDVFQCVLILFSGSVILIVGWNSVGGIGKIWEALDRGQRLTFFKFDLDPSVRGTIWSYIFSAFLIYIYQFGVNQSSLQRYLSLSTFDEVNKSLWIQSVIMVALLLIQFTIGGIIYTTYEDCDPLMAGIVKKIDQIFPHFVQEKASLFAGFNGIFIAGVFAAGLSTASTLLNTLGGTIYSDFLGSRLKITSEKTFNWTMKIIVSVVGVTSVLLVLLIERMGTIFAITTQCFTLSTVGVFGLFISGMFFPKINSKGAKCGVTLSMLIVGALIIGGLKKKPDPILPLRIDGCDFTNSTFSIGNHSISSNITPLMTESEDLPWIFRINFQYYNIIGLAINISCAYIVSILSGANEVTNQKLLVTFLRKSDRSDALMSCTSTT